MIRLSGIAFLLSLVPGCVSDIGPAPGAEADGKTGTVSQPLAAETRLYYYFRSNSTGWNPDSANRLRPTGGDPYAYALLYDVSQSWMTTGGDQAVFTRTDQFDGWGTSQDFYGTVQGTLRVPGSDLMNTGGNFSVVYPELGRYKVVADWLQGVVTIAPASTAERWQPCMNENVTTVAQSPQAQGNALVGCSNGDIFLTFDALSLTPQWTKVDSFNTSAGTFNLPDLPVNAIAYSPKDTKTAYVAFAGSKQGRKLWKTGTGGANWMELSNAPLAEIWSISVNPLDPFRIYITGPGGVYMSPDSGATWTADVTPGPLTVPLASGSKLSTVTVSPQNQDIIWLGATNGDIFHTENATSGQTWAKGTHGMPARMVLHVAVDASQPHTRVIATFDGLYNDSVWITTNGGFGWANLHTANLPVSPIPLPGVYGLYGVSPNPVDSTVLYINGAYGSGVSTSSGATWFWVHTD